MSNFSQNISGSNNYNSEILKELRSQEQTGDDEDMADVTDDDTDVSSDEDEDNREPWDYSNDRGDSDDSGIAEIEQSIQNNDPQAEAVRIAAEEAIARQALQETRGMSIPSEMEQYIEEIQYRIILLGPIELNEYRVHGNIQYLGVLTNKQKKLFRYINRVLQSPACIKSVSTTWTPNTMRNYRYAMRDYVLFMADHKIKGRDVDETNFEVDGTHMVDCMRALIRDRDVAAGKKLSGWNRKLATFKTALEGLQALLALYETSKIADPKKSNEKFLQLKKVHNTNLVSTFLAERITESKRLERINFVNKDRDNMFFERYSWDDLIKMSDFAWNKTGSSKKSELYEGVNGGMELHMGNSLLYRGDNKRKSELSDTVYTVESTSRGDIPILGIQLTHSKTMAPDGRPRCMGACRAKDPAACLVSAYAFMLWFRFDFEEGPLYGDRRPNFLSKESWYPVKILFSSRQTIANNAISYNHESKIISECLKHVGFSGKKKTHASRKSGAQSADANRIGEDQILRAGHWANSALIKYYLSPYPYDFIHGAAGFSQEEPYFIARDIDPPEELKKLVFPWAEEWIELVENRSDNLFRDSPEGDGVILKFLKMLLEFRSIIIQDLAVRMDKNHHCIYSRHEVAKHPLFEEFRIRMRRTLERDEFLPEVPGQFQIFQRISPLVSTAFQQMKGAINTAWLDQRRETENLKSMVHQIGEALKERDREFSTQFQRLTELECNMTALQESNRQMKIEMSEVRHEMHELNVKLGNEKFDALPADIGELKYSMSQIVVSLGGGNIGGAPKEPTTTEGSMQTYARKRKKDVKYPLDLEDLRIRLQKHTHVMVLIDEWFASDKPRKLSIVDREELGPQWRAPGTPQHALFKRKTAIMNFMKLTMSPGLANDSLTVRQLAWILDVYKAKKRWSLSSLIDKAIEKNEKKKNAMIELNQMWSALSEDELTWLKSIDDYQLDDLVSILDGKSTKLNMFGL